MLNISARNTQILINGKDFSSCLISFQGSDSHLDQSGLITFTGTIILGRSLLFDESLDDRKNSRFSRGVPIIINIADSTGALRRHPRGALRILTPKYDEESQRLTLEVGDLITLLNFKEPTDPDKADNKSPTGKTAGQIIHTLLNLAGITAISGVLPNTIYNYPLNLSGSYLTTVGKLLYANNLFAWIDKNEILQIRTANIAPGGISINLQIGRDEIWYRRLEGAEAPCEIIKAVGSETIVRPIPEIIEYTVEEYGSAITVDYKYDDELIITINKIRRVQSWNKAQKKLTTTTSTSRPFGLVIPEIFHGTNPALLTLIQAEIVVETLSYESGESGKLKSKKTEIYTAPAGYLAEYKEAKPSTIFTGIYSLSLSKRINETYTYDAKERLQKITTTTSERAIIILNGTEENWSDYLSAPTYFITSQEQVQEWRELNKDTWEYSTSTLRCLVRVDAELVKYKENSTTDSNKLNLIYATGERRISNSGQETPPACERRPPDCTYEENQIKEEIQIFAGISSNLKPRERTFSVDLICGRLEPALKPGAIVTYAIGGSGTPAANQLKAIATREARLLQGRYKGQEIATAMVDAIFNYHPLMSVWATEKDGTTQVYLADGCSWVVSPQRALWNCDGIWVGSSFGGVGGVVVPPYTEPSLNYLGLGLGLQIKGYAYPLEPITQQMQLGLGLGTANWPGESSFESIESIYWEDIEDWDISETTWNGIQPSPTWEDSDWDTIDWDKLQ